MGRGQGHVTYFLNFGTTSVTFERVKLDTSFLSRVSRLTRDTPTRDIDIVTMAISCIVCEI